MKRAWQVEELVALVRRRYPDWDGFDHPPFVADEIAYKQASIAKAHEWLSEAEMLRLLGAWAFDEILERLERLGRDNNLLWVRVPRRGDLGILYEPGLDKGEFVHQLAVLLYGDEPVPDRLHTFVRYADAAGLPLRWTFPTYFLFLTDPVDNIFVKPRTLDWFLKFSGVSAGLPRAPSAPAYALVLRHVALLQQALADFRPRDMVDMQSFIWVAFRESEKLTGGLNVRAQVELDIPPTAYTVEAPVAILREGPETESARPEPESAWPELAAAGEPAVMAPYPLETAAAETGFALPDLQRWVRAIERRRQAILYGPPGTGKTFLARKLAQHLVAGSDGFVTLVQFHPAYSYEEFIQGIRPVVGPEGQVGYEMVPGRFLSFVRAAQGRSGRCVLIIDEINRANLARVFGELMYLLEYREEAIPLAGGGVLEIPVNVRVIGTMNTADRSIALVDHALQRRFAFIRLQPNYDILRWYHAQFADDFPVEKLISVLQDVNRQIDDPNFALGVSYFLRPDLASELVDVWQTEIEPYLEEYFFNQLDQVERFRWRNVERALAGRRRDKSHED